MKKNSLVNYNAMGPSPLAGSSNLLSSLQKRCNVVIDSADLGIISQISGNGFQDVTTNPSLIYSASKNTDSNPMISRAAKKCQTPDDFYESLATEFGMEILNMVPGRVSVQLDIQNADDCFMTMFRARKMVQRFEDRQISRERILVKIASTWEGIQAAEKLEAEGIRCLLTLTVSEIQARAAADAGVSMIATYVGRISDCHSFKQGRSQPFPVEDDPGVQLTARIQDYYRIHGYKTEVMGASFRSVDQIMALAECDHLTIAPQLIHQLLQLDSSYQLNRKISIPSSSATETPLNFEQFETGFREDWFAVSVYDQSFKGFLEDTRQLRNCFFEAISG